MAIRRIREHLIDTFPISSTQEASAFQKMMTATRILMIL